MAVIEGVPGVEVGLLVKKELAHEYQDTEADLEDDTANESGPTKQITRYIESLTDEEFQITVAVTGKHSAPLVFYVYIDGVRSFYKPITLDEMRRMGNEFKYVVLGKRVGHFNQGNKGYQAFKFSRIETSSDEKHKSKAQEDADKLKDVGTIQVEVHKARKIPLRLHHHHKSHHHHSKLGGKAKPQNNTPSIVHEKAMKGQAKSHSVALGDVKYIQRPFSTEKYEALGDMQFPMARFIFKYRSKDALKKLLVIRQTSEPDLLEGLGNEERVKAQRYIEELRNNATPGSADRKGVKRERAKEDQSQVSQKKSKKPSEVEWVDLTED